MLLGSSENKSGDTVHAKIVVNFRKGGKTQLKNSKSLQPQNHYHDHITPLSLQLTTTLSTFHTQPGFVTILLNIHHFALPIDTHPGLAAAASIYCTLQLWQVRGKLLHWCLSLYFHTTSASLHHKMESSRKLLTQRHLQFRQGFNRKQPSKIKL